MENYEVETYVRRDLPADRGGSWGRLPAEGPKISE